MATAEQEIDGEEAAFMLDFFSLLEAAHFRVLSRDDWDTAMENDFTVIFQRLDKLLQLQLRDSHDECRFWYPCCQCKRSLLGD